MSVIVMFIGLILGYVLGTKRVIYKNNKCVRDYKSWLERNKYEVFKKEHSS